MKNNRFSASCQPAYDTFPGQHGISECSVAKRRSAHGHACYVGQTPEPAFPPWHTGGAPSLYCSLMAWLVRRSSGTLTPAIVRSVESANSSVHSGACARRSPR